MCDDGMAWSLSGQGPNNMTILIWKLLMGTVLVMSKSRRVVTDEWGPVKIGL